MPRRLPTYVLAVIVAAAATSCMLDAQQTAHKQHKRLERNQIEALEKQWQQAVLTADIPTMDKLLSDDYLGIEANGEVVTKTQQLDHMRSRQFVIEKLQTSDIKIKLLGSGVAVVTSLAQVTGIVDGEHLQGAFRYTRIYQHSSNGSWKVTNFEVTPSTRMHSQTAPQS